MFVLGDVRFDARVRREANTLVAAGHRVTIVGRSTDPSSHVADWQPREGIEIVRVAVPGRLRRFLLRGASSGGTTSTGAPVGSRQPSSSAMDQLTDPPPNDRGSLLRGAAWLIRLRLGAFAWAHAAAAAAPMADVWHGHDLPGLVAAASASRRSGGRLVYDAHEIYVEAGRSAASPAWAKRLVQGLERRLATGADAIVTVNDAVAMELRRRLGMDMDGGQLAAGPAWAIVRNCPPSMSVEPPSGLVRGPLRDATGLGTATPIALYHGSLVAGRGVERLLAAVREPGLEAVHAAFLGAGPLESLIRDMARAPGLEGRVHLLPMVDPDVLLEWVAGADVAVVATAPSTLNNRLGTPNKLFEAIAAGVPVVASDFPGIREIVADPAGPLGVLVDPTSPAAIAAGIRQILEAPAAERAALRARCLAAAHARWNWETESARLIELYGRLTGQPW